MMVGSTVFESDGLLDGTVIVFVGLGVGTDDALNDDGLNDDELSVGVPEGRLVCSVGICVGGDTADGRGVAPDGDDDGFSVGFTVGVLDGEGVGRTVGIGDGRGVGLTVGFAEGSSTGDDDGSEVTGIFVGALVGLFVGTPVGFSVTGFLVGASVGAIVGKRVNCGVGMGLGAMLSTYRAMLVSDR